MTFKRSKIEQFRRSRRHGHNEGSTNVLNVKHENYTNNVELAKEIEELKEGQRQQFDIDARIETANAIVCNTLKAKNSELVGRIDRLENTIGNDEHLNRQTVGRKGEIVWKVDELVGRMNALDYRLGNLDPLERVTNAISDLAAGLEAALYKLCLSEGHVADQCPENLSTVCNMCDFSHHPLLPHEYR